MVAVPLRARKGGTCAVIILAPHGMYGLADVWLIYVHVSNTWHGFLESVLPDADSCYFLTLYPRRRRKVE